MVGTQDSTHHVFKSQKTSPYLSSDDVDPLAEEELELQAIVESLDKICTRHKMEIPGVKTKPTINSLSVILSEIKVKKKNRKLGTVTSFNYLGAMSQM